MIETLDIWSSVPTKIEWRYTYYPILYFANNNWFCEYKIDFMSFDEVNLLFKIKAESLEDLIWKIWEHIEKHEYSEIYDLTYNFKKYEIEL